MNLKGKVAIVTASTSGIGFGIAKQFVIEGCSVVVSSRKSENVERAVKELEAVAASAGAGVQVFGTQCDLLNKDDLATLVTKTIEKFGKLDVLVAHTYSANYFNSNILESSEQEWDAAFNDNVRAARQLARLAYPHLKDNDKGGSIIFISQVSAYTHPAALGIYPVAKATVIAMTKAVASHVSEWGVRVNCITPGVIETKFSEFIRHDAKMNDAIIDNTAMHRYGNPSEVAGVAVFLASDYSSYVTGESIVVAGGAPVSHF